LLSARRAAIASKPASTIVCASRIKAALTCASCLRFPGMPPRTLGQQQQASDDEHRDDCGSQRPAERQAAVAYRLVEEVADGRAERSRQDERRPEQCDAGNARPVVEGCKNG